jgi:flagellar hook assembly protein FlgD
LQNYPNPFHQETVLSWFIPEAAQVTVDIYDLLGRHVINLIKGRFEKSTQSQKIIWNGANSRGEMVPSGIYFAVMKTEKEKLVRKLIFLRGKTATN